MRSTIALLLLLLSATALADVSTPPGAAPGKGASKGDEKGAKPYLVASLRRTACLGTCPIYTVKVFSDGAVAWEGDRYVKVTGKASARLAPEQLAALRAAFAEAGYLDLGEGFDCYERTDNPSAFTSYSDGKRTKEIKHYYGCRSKKGIEALTRLETQFDRIVATERWVGPNRE